MSAAADTEDAQDVRLTIPKKLGFLLEMHPYKVAYGGRHGLKTRSFALALLTLGTHQQLRVLCCREIMNSIKESVYQELKDCIETLGLGWFYEVLNSEIKGRNGTAFIFSGLAGHSVQSIKSFANIDVAWVEEAQTVKKRSWDILIPTIRKPGSEIWVSFNPDMDTDDTWVRFIGNPPPGTKSVKMGWEDAAEMEAKHPGQGWFPPEQEAKRLHCQKYEPDDYDNIWEGKPRTVVAGAIYAREMTDMIEEGRVRPLPYDPRFPVHTIWDLGWNDAMTILMVQKPHPSVVNVINYREDSGRRYDELIGELERLNYRWGFDWLPHDATQHHPTSGTSAEKILRGLNRRVKIIPKSDPEARIKAARMMFPGVYIDPSERKTASGYLGGARLIECLKRYRRNVPRTTNEPSEPVHDFASHAADAYGGLAEIVSQIRSEERPAPPPLPGYSNPIRATGMLG